MAAELATARRRARQVSIAGLRVSSAPARDGRPAPARSARKLRNRSRGSVPAAARGVFAFCSSAEGSFRRTDARCGPGGLWAVPGGSARGAVSAGDTNQARRPPYVAESRSGGSILSPSSASRRRSNPYAARLVAKTCRHSGRFKYSISAAPGGVTSRTRSRASDTLRTEATSISSFRISPRVARGLLPRSVSSKKKWTAKSNPPIAPRGSPAFAIQCVRWCAALESSCRYQSNSCRRCGNLILQRRSERKGVSFRCRAPSRSGRLFRSTHPSQVF